MNFFKKIKRIIKNKSRALALLFAVAVTPLFSGCGTETQSGYMVNLEIWGTSDDSMVYAEVFNQYKTINPYIGEMKFRKFSMDTYKQELLDALASGQGPDIFLISNSWLPSFENKLQSAPTPLMSEVDVKDNFPDVVASDFMSDGKVYAAPLSIDSLALYYNKDMFNAAGITTPPKTWQEFQADVKKLTIINSVGNIVQSGAAIGTGANVNRSPDLLSLLMFQNGVELPMKKGVLARIDESVTGPDGNMVQAGEQALGFYTNFAKLSTSSNMINPFYTWNNRQNYSMDAFAEGTAAMMINYSWQLEEVKNKNPKLNFGVASVPQIYPDKPVNNANYWGYAVAKNKIASVSNSSPVSAPVSNDVRTHEAWQFLRFLTLKNSGTVALYNAITKNSKEFPINFDPALDYLKKTNQPAARRDLIEKQKTDINFGPFASGNLIAKHWYQVDSDSVDKIFVEMIESVNRGDVTLHEALSLARNRINYSSAGSNVK
ncbi:MAG: hypothetical protein ACD_67C00055G0003 [uncultured bacterium]|nr:MAG: hypothetical protein ACD_67C00055G0003 [uncultured bacterium]